MTNSNVPELSVSELAFSLKKAIEDGFGRVRVRGELSKVKIHSSGHLYSDLKDADALINIVCWKGTVSRLSLRPEEGLEVICTGKITTYPARSNYQMVVEHMELAGEGALLKMLEDRRKKLAAEGLFDAARKKKIPFLPEKIGVVTSPTGAVIRDILHRLSDRFPRDVLLWPVNVQGAGAAESIADAIRGFNNMPTAQRPDVLIVARGGGSLEDLMPFNEEIVIRTTAECTIPVISAVGHETDTTLIDYASDLRAPTPTAAAEMAVPERINLIAGLQELHHRLTIAQGRIIKSHRQDIATLAARLKDPQSILDLKSQNLDQVSDQLTHALDILVQKKRQDFTRISAAILHPRQRLEKAQQALSFQNDNLKKLQLNILRDPQQKLTQAAKMLEILSFKSVLQRGFAVVRNDAGELISSHKIAAQTPKMHIQFHDGEADVVPSQVKS